MEISSVRDEAIAETRRRSAGASAPASRRLTCPPKLQRRWKPARYAPRTTRLLLVVIVAAVLLRVGAALYHGSSVDPLPGVTDQLSYHALALRVMDGHGFSFDTGWWPATRAEQPTAHWSFLYVLFLTVVYSVFGPSPLAARIIQAVIVGVLQPWLTWRIGRRLFGETVGLVSAAISAGYLYFAYYGGALVTESLYIVAFLWVLDLATALALAVRAGQPARLRPYLLLGVACAIAVLLRQLFLLMVPAVLAWLAWQVYASRRASARPVTLPVLAARLAIPVVVVAACVLPWTVRNYRAFGEVVLLNTNAGFVFFWANHPIHGTRFVPILPNDPDVNYMTLIPRELRSLNEAQLDKALLLRGLGFVRDEPVRYLRLSISRVEEYVKFWPSSQSSRASNLVRMLSFGVFAPFLAGGLFLAFTGRRREEDVWTAGALLLVLVAVLYTLIHLATWTLVRYRLPVDAILMPFAGLAVAFVFQRLSIGRSAGAFPSTVASAKVEAPAATR